MMPLAGLLIAWAGEQAAPPPVPPPLVQTGADCGALAYASDQLVCGDAALLALDRRLADAVASADGARLLRPVSPLMEPQEAWFRRRSLCAMQGGHRDCLMAAYRERLDLAATVGRPPPLAGQVLHCRLGSERRSAALQPDGRLLWGDAAEVLAVAWPRGSGAWQPFLTWQRRGSHIALTSLGGASARCDRPR